MPSGSMSPGTLQVWQVSLSTVLSQGLRFSHSGLILLFTSRNHGRTMGACKEEDMGSGALTDCWEPFRELYPGELGDSLTSHMILLPKYHFTRRQLSLYPFYR